MFADNGLRSSAAIRYLLLSMLTGVLELGGVLYAARSGWSMVAVVSLGLGYQVAALFVRPFALSPRRRRVALVVGLLTGCAATVVELAIPGAILATAVGLQGVREEQLAVTEVATPPKRVARIAGFLVAATFNPWWLVALPLLVLGVTAGKAVPASSQESNTLRFDRYALLMVVHQTHYFSYSYALLFVIADLYHGRAFVSAAVFALGWITYTSSPVLLNRFATLPVLVTGHLFVVFVVVLIGEHLTSPLVVTAAWIASGLGGGTVFCIKRLAQRHQRQYDDLDAWENLGHVFGSMCSVVAVATLSDSAPFLLAAAFAGSTAGLAVVISLADPKRSDRADVRS